MRMAKGRGKQSAKTQAPYARQKYLCTNGEWRFCQVLEQAVGDQFTVMMQVRVGSLLNCPAKDWERWGRRVSQKSFDFALVAKGSSYVAGVIELDDKTHLLPERRKRDKFLDEACRRAELPLIRFKTARHYDVDQVRETVRAGLPKGACIVRPNSAAAQPRDVPSLGWVWRRVGKLPRKTSFQS